MRWLVWICAAACAHGAAAGSAGFGISFPDQRARVGKHFEAQPAGSCRYDDGRDAHWATTGAHLESGDLPPGVKIIDGAINGVPTQAGTYHARIVFEGVTCAGKQLADQHVDATVTVR